MTQFTTDPIETLEDWNAVLVSGGAGFDHCCCEMPSCPVPTKECEIISGTGQVGFVSYDTLNNILYGKRRTDYDDGGFIQRVASSIHWTILGGVWIEPVAEVVTEGDPKTGGSTVTFSEIVDVDASRAASVAAMTTALDWATMTKGTGCASIRENFEPSGGIPVFHVVAEFVRFRWIVPDTFKGSYFKITWDILNTPTDIAATKSYIEDLTWEWIGPGDPLDPDSWKSPWFEITPPGEPGTRTIVNIRYECYRSTKFGGKPQITGTAEDLTDDVPLQRRFTSDQHSINLATL